ncbi:MAG: acyltransferase [Streptococcaceae bacterium]|jgi:acetyltransferase-like isoleucine patch superfamily enzyme|nr:acyltransferase [Streptococcaceae bacterium]
MNVFLSNIISKIKKSNYKLDKNIPITYLFLVVFDRILMLIRGMLLFCKKQGLVFVGTKVKVRCKAKIKIGKYVTIANNCYIDALSKNGITLGNNVTIGKNTIIECTGNLQFLGKGLIVGDNVGLGTNCFFGCAGGVEIGDDTIFGNFVSVHSENHNCSSDTIPIRLQGVSHKGIIIGQNCWIGAKVTILDGAIIEDGCVVAAGSVVTTGRYEKNRIYGGVPAKYLKKRNEK